MFDAVRKLFAATDEAQARGYCAGRFSFNVAEGRCDTCQGEGFVAVELLFLPGTYAPCPTCHGTRYDAETLEVTYRGRSIADVLAMSVDEAAAFLADVPAAARSLETLRDVGLGYLRLGQPATELQRRRGPAHQARDRAATGPPRARALPARRADLRPAPGRHRAAAAPAAPAGRRRQHRRPRRARPRRHRRRRLGHRPRSSFEAPPAKGTWRDVADVGTEEARVEWAEAAREVLIETAGTYRAVLLFKELRPRGPVPHRGADQAAQPLLDLRRARPRLPRVCEA